MPGMHFRPSPYRPRIHSEPVHLKGLTEDEYKAFLKENPDGLESLPKKARTAEMCRYAMECKGYTDMTAWIKDCWENFKFLPEELFTEENCAVFLESGFKEDCKTKKYQDNTDYYKWIIKWNSLRNKALAIDSTFLAAMPKRQITQEYCDIAFHTCHSIIKWVPDKYITADMCYAAVKEDGMLIQFVPHKFMSEDICDMAIRYSLDTLDFIPEEKLTVKNKACIQTIKEKIAAKEKAAMEAELVRMKVAQEKAHEAFIKHEEERKAKLMENAPTEEEYFKSLICEHWEDASDESNAVVNHDNDPQATSIGPAFDDDFFANIEESLLGFDEDTLIDLVKKLASANNPANNAKYYSAIKTATGRIKELFEEGEIFISDCIYLEEILKEVRGILPYSHEISSSERVLHIDLGDSGYSRGFNGRIAYFSMVSSGLIVKKYDASKGFKCYIDADGNLIETIDIKPALICRENNCNLVVITPEEDKGTGFDFHEDEVKGIVSAFREIHPECRIMVLSYENRYPTLKEGEQIRSLPAFQNEISAIINSYGQ